MRNYEGKFRGLKGSFVSQEEASRFGARQQDVMRRLQGRASELMLKGQIQESRQAFEEGLKGDLLRRDYQGATRRRIQAYEAGIISENGMNDGILEDIRNGLLDEYEQDMLINPSVAFTKLGDGYFDALGAGEVLKRKEKTRRFYVPRTAPKVKMERPVTERVLFGRKLPSVTEPRSRNTTGWSIITGPAVTGNTPLPLSLPSGRIYGICLPPIPAKRERGTSMTC